MEQAGEAKDVRELMKIARFYAGRIGFTGEDLKDSVMQITEHLWEMKIPPSPLRDGRLHLCARRFALDLWKRATRHRKHEVVSSAVVDAREAARVWASAADARTPEDHALLAELREGIEAALAKLSPFLRELYRRHLQGDTDRELAAAYDRTPGSIRRHIDRAHRRVLCALERKGMSRTEAEEYLALCVHVGLLEVLSEDEE